MLLNTRQVACELGFLTAPEFAALTGSTLRSIERMEKFRGHLYNWYNTETLSPLDKAPFVSSVDSGNLVASLYTLHAGTRALANKPLLRPEIFAGLRAHLCTLRKSKDLCNAVFRIKAPETSAGVTEWIAWLPVAQSALAAGIASARKQDRDAWWIDETLNRVDAVLTLLRRYLPWLLPEFAPLRLRLQLGQGETLADFTPAYAAQFASDLQSMLTNASESLLGNPSLQELARAIARVALICHRESTLAVCRSAQYRAHCGTAGTGNGIWFSRRARPSGPLHWL